MIKKVLFALVAMGFFLVSCSDDDDGTEMMVPNAGMISGGPFAFCVDGTPDMVSGISLDDTEAVGSNSSWIITDAEANILGLPPTMEALEGVNFDDAGEGVCLIWYIRYEDGLSGLEVGMNATELEGVFDLSNSLEVVRTETMGGEISGGPFEFYINGMPDMLSGITLDDTDAKGSLSTWVITDDQGNILGLPPTMEALEGVDFDGAGVGTCLIWYLRYEEGIEGLETGMNASDLEGCFALSNSITVDRIEGANAGTIAGGPFTFCVDGTADMVSGITLDDSDATGSNSTWVVTDDMGKILGLPPTMEALEGVDFDGAGAGVCLIWYARWEGEIEGAEVGNNASDITGNFALSNSIEVTRNQPMAGTISGGPFNFTIDGTPDMVSGITLDDSNASGTNSTWVITDDAGNILGLPPTLEAVEGVDFDGAGVGVCLIWYLRFEDELVGAEMGMNANDLEGCFALSNSITVNRTAP
ncbi:hypothetical protein HX109_00810 [Galbibacter sp. BG1]|uniref:hypothetical protein n=1 Tax=Galbibacter sp. BG1 TaxID=1170699 RepID=UPI0015BBF691|nr:hypothetical protein [Galbibacter sp. BG1]QLE00170.1 hypothetical protein HX109_00810 [Galbibacter sp. BG1]